MAQKVRWQPCANQSLLTAAAILRPAVLCFVSEGQGYDETGTLLLANRLFAHVPDMQEVTIARRLNPALRFSSRAIQRGPNLFLRFGQVSHRDFNCGTGFQIVEIRQNAAANATENPKPSTRRVMSLKASNTSRRALYGSRLSTRAAKKQ